MFVFSIVTCKLAVQLIFSPSVSRWRCKFLRHFILILGFLCIWLQNSLPSCPLFSSTAVPASYSSLQYIWCGSIVVWGYIFHLFLPTPKFSPSSYRSSALLLSGDPYSILPIRYAQPTVQNNSARYTISKHFGHRAIGSISYPTKYDEPTFL